MDLGSQPPQFLSPFYNKTAKSPVWEVKEAAEAYARSNWNNKKQGRQRKTIRIF